MSVREMTPSELQAKLDRLEMIRECATSGNTAELDLGIWAVRAEIKRRSIANYIERAKEAQQKHEQQHDVQLEISSPNDNERKS
jgi:hypothetical protein